MKKFNLLLSLFSCVLLLFGSVACGSDDDDFDIESALPATARTFIHTHYPGQKVKTIRTLDQAQEAILMNGTYIRFDKNGNWKNIDEFNLRAIPQSIIDLIPNKIPAYFATTFPGSIISQVEIKSTGNYSIELVEINPANYIFDNNGDFLRTEADVDGEDLPETAKEFIRYHFDGIKIVISTKKENDYEIFFNNGIRIDFVSSGIWKKVDGYLLVELPTSVINLLHEKAINYLKENHKKNKVSSIEKTIENSKEYYKVGLVNLPDRKIIFDTEGNLID